MTKSRDRSSGNDNAPHDSTRFAVGSVQSSLRCVTILKTAARETKCSQVHLNKSTTGLQLANNEARSENRSIIIYNHFVIHSDFIGQVTGRIRIIAKKFKICAKTVFTT